MSGLQSGGINPTAEPVKLESAIYNGPHFRLTIEVEPGREGGSSGYCLSIQDTSSPAGEYKGKSLSVHCGNDPALATEILQAMRGELYGRFNAAESRLNDLLDIAQTTDRTFRANYVFPEHGQVMTREFARAQAEEILQRTRDYMDQARPDRDGLTKLITKRDILSLEGIDNVVDKVRGPVGLFYFDLSGMKFGNDQGPAVRKKINDFLESIEGHAKTAFGKNLEVCRYEGDEFLVFFNSAKAAAHEIIKFRDLVMKERNELIEKSPDLAKDFEIAEAKTRLRLSARRVVSQYVDNSDQPTVAGLRDHLFKILGTPDQLRKDIYPTSNLIRQVAEEQAGALPPGPYFLSCSGGAVDIGDLDALQGEAKVKRLLAAIEHGEVLSQREKKSGSTDLSVHPLHETEVTEEEMEQYRIVTRQRQAINDALEALALEIERTLEERLQRNAGRGMLLSPTSVADLIELDLRLQAARAEDPSLGRGVQRYSLVRERKVGEVFGSVDGLVVHVLVMDYNHFGSINAGLGHRNADQAVAVGLQGGNREVEASGLRLLLRRDGGGFWWCTGEPVADDAAVRMQATAEATLRDLPGELWRKAELDCQLRMAMKDVGAPADGALGYVTMKRGFSFVIQKQASGKVTLRDNVFYVDPSCPTKDLVDEVAKTLHPLAA